MIGRLLISASLAALLATPMTASADQHRRRGVERPVSRDRSSWYDRERRIRQSERRHTEYRRLRDRQERNRQAERRRDYEAWDSIDEED